MSDKKNNDKKNSGTNGNHNFRIDVAEAEALIHAAMPHFGTVSTTLTDAGNQILAQDIIAERDQPPFDRATMDGIAVSSSALAADCRNFSISGIQAAGQEQSELTASDACIETMTGAVMPAGCDTMIPVERITVNNETATLEDAYTAASGQFVHPQGSDHKAGDLLLQPSIRINAAEMAILTAAGQPTVQVAAWPEIAIISTGDELVDVGEPINAAQIRSSNDRAIETALHNRGCNSTQRHHLPDNPEMLLQKIRTLHDETDILILSGGVSMGKYDYVPAILDELGVKLIFHKILQRPGLPMWFGISNDNKPVFALPGNPVSTLVCLIRYVIPAIETAMGLSNDRAEIVRLKSQVEFTADLCWFLPVAVSHTPEGNILAEPRPTNTSGDFIGLRGTDGFIELPRGNDNFPTDYPARLYRW